MNWQTITLCALLMGCSAEKPTQTADTDTLTVTEKTNAEADAMAARQQPTPAMNEHSQKLSALSEVERSDLLGSALKQQGVRCNAERTMFNGSTKDGQDFWSVDCGDTDQLVSITKDSTYNSMSCAVAAKFDTPCWQKWPA